MKRLFFLLTTFVLTLAAWADEVTFTGRGPSVVAVGERFRVEFSVNARGSEVRCDIEGHGFDLLYGPVASSSYSTSYVGGKMTSSTTTTFSYTLMAQKEGTFTLPAATVKVDGKTYTSNTVTVKVLPPDSDAAASGKAQGRRQEGAKTSADGKVSKDDVHLHLDLSRTTAYEGEAIVATLKLYCRNTDIASVADAKLPDFEGFTAQEIELGNIQGTRERYNGDNYRMYPLKKWVLFPSRSGEIRIPAASLKAVAQVVTRRSSGGFFDFPMNYTQNVDVPLTSAERTVHVKALPSGRPASYLGGVGDFRLKAEMTADKVKAGDAFIYRLTLSGTGNLKYVRDPEPDFPVDFEVYDPKVDLNVRTTESGMTGQKVIEYTVIPRFAGTFRIAPVELSYFDPKAGQYRTVQAEAFDLEVERGADDGGTQGGVSDFSGSNRERLKVLGNDIRYLHPIREEALARGYEPFYGTWPFWMFFLVPSLLFALLAVVYRRRLRLNADLDRKRTRGASKAATRRLKDAAAALRAKDGKAFYESVHKAMLGYVGDKLNLQMTDLSSDNLREQLARRGADEALVGQVAEILSTCEFARYAPSGDSQAMDKLYAEAVAAIERLEDCIKR